MMTLDEADNAPLRPASDSKNTSQGNPAKDIRIIREFLVGLSPLEKGGPKIGLADRVDNLEEWKRSVEKDRAFRASSPLARNIAIFLGTLLGIAVLVIVTKLGIPLP